VVELQLILNIIPYIIRVHCGRAIATLRVQIPPAAAVYQRQLNMPSLRGELMSTNQSVAYLHIKAAFDSVDRRALWKALHSTGVPDFLIDLIAALRENTGAQVRSGNNLSNRFQATSGVRQGCILVPALFSVAIDWILNHTSYVHKTRHLCWCASVHYLVYADDHHLFRLVCIRCS